MGIKEVIIAPLCTKVMPFSAPFSHGARGFRVPSCFLYAPLPSLAVPFFGRVSFQLLGSRFLRPGSTRGPPCFLPRFS